MILETTNRWQNQLVKMNCDFRFLKQYCYGADQLLMIWPESLLMTKQTMVDEEDLSLDLKTVNWTLKNWTDALLVYFETAVGRRQSAQLSAEFAH